jgi:hypothetical protein
MALGGTIGLFGDAVGPFFARGIRDRLPNMASQTNARLEREHSAPDSSRPQAVVSDEARETTAEIVKQQHVAKIAHARDKFPKGARVAVHSPRRGVDLGQNSSRLARERSREAHRGQRTAAVLVRGA